MRLKQILVLLGLSVALSGCLGVSTTVESPPDTVATIIAPADAPTHLPEPTAIAVAPTAASEPAATLTPEPDATASPEPTTAPTVTLAAEPVNEQYGVTEDGYFWRGLASAPVVIEDYSDFL